MKKVFGAIVITAVALATTAAFAESTVSEQRAELAKLWGQEQTTGHEAVAGRETVAGRIVTQASIGNAKPVEAKAGDIWATGESDFRPYTARDR